MANRTCRVVFQFSSQTIFGEKVRIVGNHPSLGNWDPWLGMQLTTDGNSYPLWIAPTPVSLPLSCEIEYKYVYTSEQSAYRWEALKENRKLFLEHTNMLIEDEENTPISRHIFNHTEAQAKPHNFELPKVSIDDSVKFTLEDNMIIASFNLPIKVTRNENLTEKNPQK